MASKSQLRLWPLWVLLILDVAVVLWIWRGEIDQRQAKIMTTMGIQLIFALLAGLHLLFFAKLSGKARQRLLLGGMAFAILLFATVEIREVSGDVVPILAWRWSKPPEATLANEDLLGQAAGEAVTEDLPNSPHFLGPNGNGIYSGPDIATDWDTNPPQEVWRIEIGSGWSGFATYGWLALTQEQRGEKEMVTCYNLQTGELIWAQGYPQRFESTIAGDGPRATPTIDRGLVFTMGANGHLTCSSLDNGAMIWQQDLVSDYGARRPEWGFAGSPAVVGDAVLINAGGTGNRLLLAFQRETGEFLWASGNDGAGYSSPQHRTIAGQEVILLLNQGSVTFHRASDGELLLSEPWKANQPNVANPLVLPDDRVLVSSGYGVGASMYKIRVDGDRFTATRLWKNLRLKAKFANYVFLGNYVYGLDDGILTCIAIEDGSRQWKSGRYGHGQLMLVRDKLLIQSEKGSLHLVLAQPEARTELASLPVLSGKAWNTMALVGDLLLMRNHREAVCLRLPANTDPAMPR